MLAGLSFAPPAQLGVARRRAVSSRLGRLSLTASATIANGNGNGHVGDIHHHNGNGHAVLVRILVDANSTTNPLLMRTTASSTLAALRHMGC